MTITQLLGQNRKQFFRYIIGALLTTVNGLSQTFALSIAFGIIEAPESSIVLRIVGMFFFAILPIPLQYLSRFLRIGFMRDVLIQVRSLAYQKIMHRPIEVFKKQSKESAMAMVVSDINLFEKDFFLAILNIVFSFGSFIIGEIILFIISPTIGFGTLLASSLLYIVVRFFEKPTREIKRLTQEANVDYTVYKNTMMARAIVGTKFEALKEILEGPSAIAISYDDAILPARILAGVMKEYNKL